MATTGATPTSLLALLGTLTQAEAQPENKQKPTDLAEELRVNNALFDIWKGYTKEEWVQFYGFKGIAIHNHLNPQTEGIEKVLISSYCCRNMLHNAGNDAAYTLMVFNMCAA